MECFLFSRFFEGPPPSWQKVPFVISGFQFFRGDHPKSSCWTDPHPNSMTMLVSNFFITIVKFEKHIPINSKNISYLGFKRFYMINLQGCLSNTRKNTFCQVNAFHFSIYCFSIFSRRPSQIVQKVHSVLFDFQSFRRNHPKSFTKCTFSTFLFRPSRETTTQPPAPCPVLFAWSPADFFY